MAIIYFLTVLNVIGVGIIIYLHILLHKQEKEDTE